MTWLRVTLIAVLAVAIGLAVGGRSNAGFVQLQRDQIAINILVNVTPAPVADRNGVPFPIDWRIAMRARGSALADMVAQAQSAIRVQAMVSPNPNATMLYSNFPNVVINQTAGTTASTAACVYTITVDTPAATSWTLKDGLSSDFITSTWPGKDVGNNTYLQAGTPQPTATPFVVYSTDGSTWNPKEKSNGKQTYCVTLTITIPSSVPGGAYTTNAVYTLYY